MDACLIRTCGQCARCFHGQAALREFKILRQAQERLSVWGLPQAHQISLRSCAISQSLSGTWQSVCVWDWFVTWPTTSLALQLLL